MSDSFDNFEIEALVENTGREARLPPDEREVLEEALSSSFEILNAPGEADADYVLAVIETLEEFHPYFSDTRISDQIGEVIELLQEIAEGSALDFEDAQDGKCAVEDIAESLGIEVSNYEI